jgi:hypothetical protein
MESTAGRAYLGLVPYMRVSDPVEFSRWWLGALDDYQGAWVSSDFEAQTRKLAAAYRDAQGEPLARVTLLADRENGAGAVVPSGPLVDAIQGALDLAVLHQNPRWSLDGRGWRVATADNAEIVFWPMHPQTGFVTLTRGSLVRSFDGGYSLDQPFTIQTPLEVNVRDVNIDPDLLGAATDLFTAADAGPNYKLRIAIRWLAKAWRNTASLAVDDRLIMLRTGFEALVDDCDTSEQAAQLLSEIYEPLRSNREITIASTEHLLWSPDEQATLPFRWTTRSGKQRESLLTPLEPGSGASVRSATILSTEVLAASCPFTKKTQRTAARTSGRQSAYCGSRYSLNLARAATRSSGEHACNEPSREQSKASWRTPTSAPACRDGEPGRRGGEREVGQLVT